jgi:hypothetical protein
VFYGAGILKIAVKSTIFLARPNKICVPKRQGLFWHIFTEGEVPNSATNPKNIEGYIHGQRDFDEPFRGRIPHTARYTLQSVSRQFNCSNIIRGWPHRGEPYMGGRKWCLCMTQAVGGQWCNRAIVHCPLSRFFECQFSAQVCCIR